MKTFILGITAILTLSMNLHAGDFTDVEGVSDDSISFSAVEFLSSHPNSSIKRLFLRAIESGKYAVRTERRGSGFGAYNVDIVTLATTLDTKVEIELASAASTSARASLVILRSGKFSKIKIHEKQGNMNKTYGLDLFDQKTAKKIHLALKSLFPENVNTQFQSVSVNGITSYPGSLSNRLQVDQSEIACALISINNTVCSFGAKL